MSGRNQKKARKKGGAPWYEAPWLTGLLLVAVAVYFGLALAGDPGTWWGVLEGAGAGDLLALENAGGPVGSVINVFLHLVFGSLWCWTIPLWVGASGFGYLLGRQRGLRPLVLRAVPLWLVTSAWIAQPGGIFTGDAGVRLGGAVGLFLARGLYAPLGVWGGRIFLTLFLLVAVILIFKPWLGGLAGVSSFLGRGLLGFGRGLVEVLSWPLAALVGLGRWLWGLMSRSSGDQEGDESASGQSAADDIDWEDAETAAGKERRLHQAPEPDAPPTTPVAAQAGGIPEERILPGAEGEFEGDGPATGGGAPRPRPRKKAKKKTGPMALPGLDLLTPAGPEGQAISATDLDQSADLLEDTLRSFGVEGEVKDVRPGPVVTTFEYQPGAGIRVNQIVQRSDDLALAMRARSIRMEAPIPGKAAVGIEIPNPTARMVRLREVLELTGTQKRNPLSVVLGKDVVGRPVSIDVAALPHLLVAGSTGSGKSVCLNAIICNLIMRNDPSRLRMILIDPKMLEMNVYNGIPHLLLPVVTDPRESLKALQWMVAQMEHRYRSLAKCSVRNIQQYNDKVARGEVTDTDGEVVTEPMPYFLTIVDELADLMLQLGNDIEGPITRLAQKARAVGIHLILATQRPSVDVLTGVIKANIPCRIAFRVIQKNDSRTVLDMNGAEQLLGHGDMLYLQPGRALPVRVHGSFIDVDECEAIAEHWRQFSGSTEEISLTENPAGGGMVTGEDDLYEQAREVVVLHQSGSTSLLQRRLRIGYTRAGRLMDMLEEAGVVGPFTGSKARDVLIKPEDLPGMEEGQA
ncbi:MAG: DNA translocase FtsK [Candidatus Krumholzibacteriota bacterium]